MWSTSPVVRRSLPLRFALDLRLDVAEQQVQAAINAAADLVAQ